MELQLLDALAFRVRLPETLTKEEGAALAATVVVDRGLSVSTDSRIFEPVVVDGRNLTFVIGRLSLGSAQK